MALDILKVKNLNEETNNKLFEKLHEHLLRPPFLLVINGNVRTGKSNLIMNLLYNDNFYKDYFDQIFFVSPTVENDDTLKVLREDEDVTKISQGLDKIDSIVETIVEHKMNDDVQKGKHWLLILDDCLGFIKPAGYVTFFATRYRQRKISMIISSQNFRSIPNIIRQNASAYLIFQTNNKKEYSKLEEEFEGLFPDFEKLYLESTDKPYNFMYLDLRHIKAYHNFTILLYSKN